MVIGLGMMGRHHARILQSSTRVQFAGAVDPGGDRWGAVRDEALVFATLEQALAAGTVDFAIVSVPTEDHPSIAATLAASGIHMLIEKPLAATADAARDIIAACEAGGVVGAVGHVERFNPALVELRRRIAAGQLGEVFLIATERVGPFPDRIRDVGVVKDLATHDLDLVRWLSDSPVERLSAQTQHRMGREHEDLVLVNGSLVSGVSFTCVVDWLSPTKVRRTRVLGERGMLIADTLTADLSFYANGDVASEWGATQALRGVSEGDMTRYALSRREPLLAEVEAFIDLIEGQPSDIVTLDQGLGVVTVAEAVLGSAAERRTVELSG